MIHHVIEKLSATASDPAFGNPILPRACSACAGGFHAAGCKQLGYLPPKLAVTIKNRVAILTGFPKGLPQLLHKIQGPVGCSVTLKWRLDGSCPKWFWMSNPNAALQLLAHSTNQRGSVQASRPQALAGHPRHPLGVLRERLGEHLERDVTPQAVVARAIHLPIPPAPIFSVIR
jgi:hypothetical protein